MSAVTYMAASMDGRQIKAARALLGWSQSELCQHAGISRATLNDLENDTGDPRRSSIARVEDAFQRHGVVFIAPGASSLTGGPGVRMSD